MTATRERIESLKHVLESVRLCTQPIDGHTDPNSLMDCWNQVDSDILALTALCEEMEREKWHAVADAPLDGTEVRLLLKSGRTLTASMQMGFVDSNNNDCSCWVCSDEDEYPECWTDGACWQVNEHGKPSDPPTHFQPLPSPPTQTL